MAFVLSLFYLLVAFLGTQTVFGDLGRYHIEEMLLVLVFCISVPTLQKAFLQKTVQSLALAGLAVAVFMSMAVGKRYVHGGITQFAEFLPNALAYFLVALHCRTKFRLKILVLLLLAVCAFVIWHGVMELRALGGFVPEHQTADSDEQDTTAEEQAQANNPDSYLMPQFNADGSVIWRLKGQNFLSDPNDFGQLLVCVLPLTFLFWRPKRLALNLLTVLPMVAMIGFGIYMTHSRGDLLAVLGVVIVAFRRRLGTIPSVIIAGGLFVGAMAVGATGGREISAGAGQDRTALWGAGLQLLKQNPIFGAGYNQMGDLVGLTAHNTIVVCAAELGFFGLFFWSLFLFPTLRDAIAVGSPEGLTDAVPQPVDESPYAIAAPKMEDLNKEDIGQMGRLVLLSLVGFLGSAMFLSRAFVMTFFMLGGIAEVVFQMALDRGMVAPRLPFPRAAAYSWILSILLVPGMYVVVRVLNLMH